MRLDARLRLRLVPSGSEPAPDQGAALVRVGTDLGADPAGWAAARTLPLSALDGHGSECRCCSGRSALADELGRLFTRRARGETGFFGQLFLSVPAALLHQTVADLENDPLIAGRYRVEL